MRRLIKQWRYQRARLKPRTNVPMFWHVGRPNFGDDINPSLFAKLTGQPTRLETNRGAPHFLGMGSILEQATPASIVVGSGFLQPLAPGATEVRPQSIVAVRGELSRARFANPDAILMGDPMVLLDKIMPSQRNPDGPIGFIPHISEVRAAKAMNIAGVQIIDPADSVWSVINDIAACSFTYCQSLHGLIVSDALGIPSIWVAPGAGMKGGRYKFDDYFSTMDASKSEAVFERGLFERTKSSDFELGTFKHDKDALLAGVRAAFRR